MAHDLLPRTASPFFAPGDRLRRCAAVYQQAQRWLASDCFEVLADDLRAMLGSRLAAPKSPAPPFWTAGRCASRRTAEPAAAMTGPSERRPRSCICVWSRNLFSAFGDQACFGCITRTGSSGGFAFSPRAHDFNPFCNDLLRCFAIEHALSAAVVGGIEAAQELLELAVGVDVIPNPSLPMRALQRSTMPLVCGVWGLVWRSCAPRSAQALAKAGVKPLPLSVSTWVRRTGKAAAASRRTAMALRSVGLSLTTR